VVAGWLFWEAQFQIARWILSGLPCKTDKERAFKKCAPSYIVSYVHAFFLAWAGWRIVFTLEPAERAEQAWLYANPDTHFVGFVEMTTLVFFTYVLYDSFHLVLEYPDLGGIDMAVHHVGFLVASFGAYVYGAYPLMLGWLCTCETSTPFLSTRWFVRQMKEMEYTQPLLDKLAQALGMKSRGLVAANRIEYYVSILFLIAFVIVRNLGYGWSLVGLYMVEFSGQRLDSSIPLVVRYLLSGLACAGFGLNLIWVHKIIGMATSEKKRKWLRKDAEQ